MLNIISSLIYFTNVKNTPSYFWDLGLTKDRNLKEEEIKALRIVETNLLRFKDEIIGIKEPIGKINDINSELNIDKHERYKTSHSEATDLILRKISSVFIFSEDSSITERQKALLGILEKLFNNENVVLIDDLKNLKELFIDPLKNYELLKTLKKVISSLKIKDIEFVILLTKSIDTIKKCMKGAKESLKTIIKIINNLVKKGLERKNENDKQNFTVIINHKFKEISDLYDSIADFVKISNLNMKTVVFNVKFLFTNFNKLTGQQKLCVVFYFEYTNVIIPTIQYLTEDLDEFLKEFDKIISYNKSCLSEKECFYGIEFNTFYLSNLYYNFKEVVSLYNNLQQFYHLITTGFICTGNTISFDSLFFIFKKIEQSVSKFEIPNTIF